MGAKQNQASLPYSERQRELLLECRGTRRLSLLDSFILPLSWLRQVISASDASGVVTVRPQSRPLIQLHNLALVCFEIFRPKTDNEQLARGKDVRSAQSRSQGQNQGTFRTWPVPTLAFFRRSLSNRDGARLFFAAPESSPGR
jgi:hypothetical protein